MIDEVVEFVLSALLAGAYEVRDGEIHYGPNKHLKSEYDNKVYDLYSKYRANGPEAWSDSWKHAGKKYESLPLIKALA